MQVSQDDGAVWWTGGAEIDADGSPFAYGPHGGLDYLGNAGEEGNWYGLACDPNRKPYVQGKTDPNPGGYVSTTALQDHSKAESDPARYVDSGTVSYVSIPKNAVKDFGLHVGDVGIAYYAKTGKSCVFVVADVGPKDKWGEISMQLAKNLGVDPDPKTGGTEAGVTYVVFKGSSKGWPTKAWDRAQQVQDLLNSTGGMAKYGLA